MVPTIRHNFNQQFTKERYEQFLQDLHAAFPGAIEFRMSETPIFIDKNFTAKLLDACEHIIDVITREDFKYITRHAIPENEKVPNESRHSHMISFDFGICVNEHNELEPQLIEMQGFPTLYCFQAYYPEVLQKHFSIPQNYSHYLNGLNKESYLHLLKELIVGDLPTHQVILLEIKPHEQKTRIDFYNTEAYLGIKPVCITELIQEGKQLFYMNNGEKTRVLRIYNRIIFDDLHAQKNSLGDIIDITQDLDVEWMPHSNWFYRISKYTLPFIQHPYVPETFFLNEVKQLPSNLENYVLKPLFSFAGQGVIIDIKEEDITNIKDPQNWILQKKVTYADVIETPDTPAKTEIRMMYIWREQDKRPIAVTNLARMSKGKMIGVRYNKDKEWVGASVCFFEQ